MKPERPAPTPPVHPDAPAGADAGESQRRWLSAALDGEAEATDPACQAWRSSAAARQAWHRYHLIGDALRSAELAQPTARDESLLQALRTRLADEPVVLAPVPRVAMPAAAAAGRPRLSAWWMSAAAASVAAVAGVAAVMVTSRAPVPAAVELAGAPPASALRVDSGVIRDAQLDEYLRVHQLTRAGMGSALPGSTLRRVEFEAAAAPAR